MISKYDEIEFVYRLPLRNFIVTDAGFRFSCPKCNEGKSPYKRRCNILTKKYDWNQVTCHNCGMSTNFQNFLRELFPVIYEEYALKERENFIKDLKEGKIRRKVQDGGAKINMNTSLQYQFKLNEKYFKPAYHFSKCIKFCKNRRIYEHIDKLFYCENLKSDAGGMIIFPFYLEDGETMYGFQGRHTEEKRFHTHSKNDGMKVFNLFGLDKSKPVIVVESIIDSLCIDNAIAMVGSDLSAKAQHFLKGYDLIYSFDHDNTGLQKAIKYGQAGNKVLVWPDMKGIKDFGDLAQLDWTKENITSFIKKYSYEGIELTARLSFETMKKRK